MSTWGIASVLTVALLSAAAPQGEPKAERKQRAPALLADYAAEVLFGEKCISRDIRFHGSLPSLQVVRHRTG